MSVADAIIIHSGEEGTVIVKLVKYEFKTSNFMNGDGDIAWTASVTNTKTGKQVHGRADGAGKDAAIRNTCAQL